MTGSLPALSEAGVSIWLDDRSRERLVSGSPARLTADDHVVGVTTNPSIIARANLLVEIPVARRGLSAIAACPAEGGPAGDRHAAARRDRLRPRYAGPRG